MQASADERPFSIPTSLLYWFVTLLASLNFALAYVRLLSQPFFFPAYAHGRVQYPYQSRILMAIVFARTEHSRFLALICALAHPPLNEPLKLLMVVVAFCAMVIAVYFVRLSLEFLTEDRNWAKWGSLSVIFMTYFQYILSSDSPFLYPYDLPEARGLVCVACEGWRLDELSLSAMVDQNTSQFGTAFTVSVDAVGRGVTTGISAFGRATTIRLLCDEHARPVDFAKPGHTFPLRAATGGVLERAGQTEAIVALCRAPVRFPAGVICEIMREDGT